MQLISLGVFDLGIVGAMGLSEVAEIVRSADFSEVGLAVSGKAASMLRIHML